MSTAPNLFRPRHGRVVTVREALQKFAGKICEESVADSIIEMLARRSDDESPALTISLKVHLDPKSPGMFAAKLTTEIKTDLGSERFYGLT